MRLKLTILEIDRFMYAYRVERDYLKYRALRYMEFNVIRDTNAQRNKMYLLLNRIKKIYLAIPVAAVHLTYIIELVFFKGVFNSFLLRRKPKKNDPKR